MDANNHRCNELAPGQDLRFQLIVTVPENSCTVTLIVRDERNATLFELFDPSISLPESGEGMLVDVNAGALPLLPGTYFVDFWFGDRSWRRMERIDNVAQFNVIRAGMEVIDRAPPSGALYFPSRWRWKMKGCVGVEA